MRVTKPLDLGLLERELSAVGIDVNGLGLSGEAPGEPGVQELYTYDDQGTTLELPAEAVPVVDAHIAPPLVTEYAGSQGVHAIVRTTDAIPLEVFRFPCLERHQYEARLTIRGIDAGNFAIKRMVGGFVWKRITANAILTGLTVVSDLHDTAAASWSPNYAVSGTDVVFTVAGAAGRTIDWFLSGDIGIFAPGGLTS